MQDIGASATCCNTLQHTATRCNTLQHITTHCNTLQQTATHWQAIWGRIHWCLPWACDTMAQPQHTAIHCDTLQHTATQHTATHRQAIWWHIHQFLPRACEKMARVPFHLEEDGEESVAGAIFNLQYVFVCVWERERMRECVGCFDDRDALWVCICLETHQIETLCEFVSQTSQSHKVTLCEFVHF